MKSERDIALQPVESVPEPVDPRPFRTLVGANQLARLTGSVNRTILGDVSATLTGEAQHSQGRSRFGVPTGTLDADDETFLLAFPGDPLTRRTKSDTARPRLLRSTGSGANGGCRRPAMPTWRGQRRAPTADPTCRTSRPRSTPACRSTRSAISGRSTICRRTAADRRASRLASTRRRPGRCSRFRQAMRRRPSRSARRPSTWRASRGCAGFETRSDLGRDSGEGSVNLDLPLAKRTSSIGRLGANFNAGDRPAQRFRDARLRSARDLNWAPSARLSFIASWTREEGAPSLQPARRSADRDRECSLLRRGPR